MNETFSKEDIKLINNFEDLLFNLSSASFGKAKGLLGQISPALSQNLILIAA